jgi:general L-amino acid transport system substrate-binding protein
MHRGRLAAAVLTFLASTSVGFAGTLDEVRARDKLICGVSEGLGGFSEQDGAGAWQGFDVDFCRAVAAAVLGDTEKVEYLPLSAEARFAALSDGRIDLLSRNSTWTMSRDLALGLDFPGTSYFDGQGFMIPAIFGAISPLELDGASICVISGTTTEANAMAYFEKAGLKVSFLSFEERDEARAAYAEARCDAYTADRSALAAERAALPAPDEHVILKDVISKEPLGPVVRDTDPQWTTLIRWTLFALIDAEEQGLDAASMSGAGADAAKAMGAPAVKALDLSEDWLVKVLAGVGNYGEVFERNLGEETPMQLSRGVNALWTQGGILYAPPMP